MLIVDLSQEFQHKKSVGDGHRSDEMSSWTTTKWGILWTGEFQVAYCFKHFEYISF